MRTLLHRFIAFALLTILSISIVPTSLWHHHEHEETYGHTDGLQWGAEHEDINCLICDSYMAPYIEEPEMKELIISTVPLFVEEHSIAFVASPAFTAGDPRAPPVG